MEGGAGGRSCDDAVAPSLAGGFGGGGAGCASGEGGAGGGFVGGHAVANSSGEGGFSYVSPLAVHSLTVIGMSNSIILARFSSR